MSEDYNPEDYQGRTQKQYETSGKVLYYTIMVLGLIAVFATATYFLGE